MSVFNFNSFIRGNFFSSGQYEVRKKVTSEPMSIRAVVMMSGSFIVASI